ncbi:putative membrane protein (plasmid) [Bacillus methanolicus MGA3]|uniref:Putative membrane protein n=1 Tax=Bacillus methanolicus (strain MGA3 / ATCC 53907) TaxID=796606 RepID=A0A068LVY0_BACMM|nr:putative membrane protein [Bacillus methanolicus MGA3]
MLFLLIVGLSYILAAIGVLLILYGVLTKAIRSGTKHIEEQLKLKQVPFSLVSYSLCLTNKQGEHRSPHHLNLFIYLCVSYFQLFP